MSANRLKNKPRDRARLKRRRLREQAQRRAAGQELPVDLLARLPPNLAAAMAAACGEPGRLFATVACYRQLSEWQAECTARGGQHVAVIVRSTNPHSCCGRDFVALSTVRMCDDPSCKADHTAKPAHVAAIRAVLRRQGPAAARVSPGWRTFGQE